MTRNPITRLPAWTHRGEWASVVLPGLDDSSILEDGGANRRSQVPVRVERLSRIETVGRWVSWWLLAQVGDAEARRFYGQARDQPPDGARARIPAGLPGAAGG